MSSMLPMLTIALLSPSRAVHPRRYAQCNTLMELGDLGRFTNLDTLNVSSNSVSSLQARCLPPRVACKPRPAASAAPAAVHSTFMAGQKVWSAGAGRLRQPAHTACSKQPPGGPQCTRRPGAVQHADDAGPAKQPAERRAGAVTPGEQGLTTSGRAVRQVSHVLLSLHSSSVEAGAAAPSARMVQSILAAPKLRGLSVGAVLQTVSSMVALHRWQHPPQGALRAWPCAAQVLDTLKQLPELRCLYLHGNPMVSAISQYRRTLIAALPGLTYLDDRPVFPIERRCAEAWRAQTLWTPPLAHVNMHGGQETRSLPQSARHLPHTA